MAERLTLQEVIEHCDETKEEAEAALKGAENAAR